MPHGSWRKRDGECLLAGLEEQVNRGGRVRENAKLIKLIEYN